MKMKYNLVRLSLILALAIVTSIITTNAQKGNTTVKTTTVEYEAPEIEHPPSNKTGKKTVTEKPPKKPIQVYLPTPIPTISVSFNPQPHYLKPKPIPNKYVNMNWNLQKKPGGVQMHKSQSKIVSLATKLSPVPFYQPTPIPTIGIPFNPHQTAMSPTYPLEKPINMQMMPTMARNPSYSPDLVRTGLNANGPEWLSRSSQRGPVHKFANTAVFSPPIYHNYQPAPRPMRSEMYVESNDTVSQGLSFGINKEFSNQKSHNYVNKYETANILGNSVSSGSTRIQRIPGTRTVTSEKGPGNVATLTSVHGNKNIRPLVLNGNKPWQGVQTKATFSNQTAPVWTANINNSLQTPLTLSMKQRPGARATFKFKPLLAKMLKTTKNTVTTTQTPPVTTSTTAPVYKWFNTITTSAPTMGMWGNTPMTTQFFTIMPTSTTPATQWQSTSTVDGFTYNSRQFKNINKQRLKHRRIQDPYLSFALEFEKLYRELHNPMYPMSTSNMGMNSALLNSKSAMMSSLLEFV